MQVGQSILKVNVHFYTSSRSIHISTMDEVLLCISIKHFLRQGNFSSKQLLSEDVLGKYSMFCVSENVEVPSLCLFSLEKCGISDSYLGERPLYWYDSWTGY